MTSLPLPPSASLSNHFSPPRHCSAGHFSGSSISVETECTSQPLLNALIHDVAFAKGWDVHSVSTEILEPEKWPALQCHRSEEHTLNSSHLGISYPVFCLKKK